MSDMIYIDDYGAKADGTRTTTDTTNLAWVDTMGRAAIPVRASSLADAQRLIGIIKVGMVVVVSPDRNNTGAQSYDLSAWLTAVQSSNTTHARVLDVTTSGLVVWIYTDYSLAFLTSLQTTVNTRPVNTRFVQVVAGTDCGPAIMVASEIAKASGKSLAAGAADSTRTYLAVLGSPEDEIDIAPIDMHNRSMFLCIKPLSQTVNFQRISYAVINFTSYLSNHVRFFDLHACNVQANTMIVVGDAWISCDRMYRANMYVTEMRTTSPSSGFVMTVKFAEDCSITSILTAASKEHAVPLLYADDVARYVRCTINTYLTMTAAYLADSIVIMPSAGATKEGAAPVFFAGNISADRCTISGTIKSQGQELDTAWIFTECTLYQLQALTDFATGDKVVFQDCVGIPGNASLPPSGQVTIVRGTQR